MRHGQQREDGRKWDSSQARFVGPSILPERSFTVFKRDGAFVRKVGIVRAVHHTQADTKAGRIYGANVWTKPTEY